MQGNCKNGVKFLSLNRLTDILNEKKYFFVVKIAAKNLQKIFCSMTEYNFIRIGQESCQVYQESICCFKEVC